MLSLQSLAYTPVVTLEMPWRSIRYVAPAAPVLYATARFPYTPAPGTILKVEFYDSDTLIGSVADSNAVNQGYAFVWRNPARGGHLISARATDSLGGITASSAVELYIVDARQPPQVALSAPDNGRVYPPASTVQLAATATSEQGSIQRVEFMAGRGVVATALTPPYTGTWINPVPGKYAIVARAIDELGTTSTSPPVFIQVLALPRVPAVVLTAPSPATVFPAGAPLVLSASALSPDGVIKRVDFYNGVALVGSVNDAPYQYIWPSPPAGSLSLTARAYDQQGASTTSAPVQVTGSSTGSPIVSLTAPVSGATSIAGDAITLSATASRAGGSIAKVDFYDGAALIGTINAAPYTTSWTTAAAGIHVLVAKATDNVAVSAISASVTLVVVPNQPPVVTLTTPSIGAIYVTGQAIVLAAAASDPDGTVNRVEFLNGAAVLGNSSTAPYVFTWNGAPVGSYAIAARATDSRGATTTSPPMTVQVAASDTPSLAILSPVDGTAYAQGQAITLRAQGSMPGRALARIEFYSDGNLLGSVPFNGPSSGIASFTWIGAVLGAHVITARVVATDGISATSAPVSITIRDFTVAMFEPLPGQIYVAPGSIRLAAFASETATTIGKVEFFRDSTLLASITTPPFTYTWDNAAAGTYTFSARATDSNGLTASSPLVNVQVLTAPALVPDAGIDGISVDDDNLIISGTVQAPSNSAVGINGQLASLSAQGEFFVNAVSLQPGSNAITLTLIPQYGSPLTRTVTVTSTGAAPFEVALDQQEGMAPLATTLTITNRGGVPFQRIEVDTTDNGTAEQTITTLVNGSAQVNLSYGLAGTYVLRVSVYDADNKVIYVARRKVHVIDASALAARVSLVYSDMLRRLELGDIDNAVNAITTTVRDKYREAFLRLGANLPSVVRSLGTVREISVTREYADILVGRDKQDGTYGYHVLLIRDGDGIWRIDGM